MQLKNVVSIPVPAIHYPRIPSLYPTIISSTVADLTKSSNCPHPYSSECHIRIPSVDNELQKLPKLSTLPTLPKFKQACTAPSGHKKTGRLSSSGFFCGEGGIRTPGSSQINGFQDRRNRPLCHLSKSSAFALGLQR